MADKKITRILLIVFLLDPILAAQMAPARASDGATINNPSAFVLATALALCMALVILLVISRRRHTAAQTQLAELSEKLQSGAEVSWRRTGVVEIDAIARTLTEVDERLKLKRQRLSEVTEQIRAAEEHRRTMNLELHHRVNNALAMIQGIANITARSATDIVSFRSNLSDRIQCVSRISTLLVSKSWSTIPVRELAETALAYGDPELEGRIDMGGENIDLRSQISLALGMTLHELFTNALHHGALSNATGRITLNWFVENNPSPKLTLIWSETGGPEVAPQSQPGVGRYLMKDVLARQFGGDIAFSFASHGMRAMMTTEI